MRLASITYRNESIVAARVDDEHLVDVEALQRIATERQGVPRRGPLGDMPAVIAGGDALRDDLAAALELVRAEPAAAPRIPAADVAWRIPVRPGKICAVAMNNSASNERKISAPDHPAFFLKPASCLVAHGEPIRIRTYYGSVHPEPELAAVIGKRARDVDATHALDCVFGYTILDDVTGNGMRAEDRFHYYAVYASKTDPNVTERVEQHLSYAGRYKGSDTFGAIGPWIATRDEIPDPDDLAVTCKVGDETIASDSTRYYNFKVAEVLSFVSQFLTLEPGDVVSMGTAFKPGATRRSIHHADLQRVAGPITISIEGLGTQVSPVVVEDREIGRWRLR
ncbi:MAG TPA: fumarylacetoacetate hydrolase family protein [Gammaproteobacteria bacterium]|nr:fumarylacetoacetate hydrolase family protein [Gammaproteobacteria bacterium]